MDILQKHLKKDHVHMRLWTRFYGMRIRFICQVADQLLSLNLKEGDTQLFERLHPPMKQGHGDVTVRSCSEGN